MMTDIVALAIPLAALVLPFAFVIAMVSVKAASRNRQFAQLMEERKLMLERGMEPPPLKLPEESRRPRDTLANLKAGIILLFVALALLLAQLLWPSGMFLGGQYFGKPAGVVAGVLGLGFVVLHFIIRAFEPRNGNDQASAGRAEEGE